MTALAGKAAIVTGGGRGIGRAVTEALRAAGADLTICGRGARPEDLPAEILWVQGDVSRADDAARICAEARAEFGPVSILVNNAGIQIEKTVTETTDDDWDRLIGANCRGVFNMCRAFIPQVPETGGSIVNLGSVSGEVADPSMAIYNASKGFVHALTRSIAVDHGPRIRCNAVRPGWIMTDMAEAGFALAHDPERARADAIARHPAGRLGAPQDVAGAILWLVSDAAGFVTGQSFTIDGGLTSASPLQPRLF
ncbi:meso-butanediol dehydrogenase / (S,S)-butanediol dehydrogenase / diacetyl reductase [Paracoccus halophilus]|uniref:Meso-butanediol dehydrogenase / (S,S)-butanediol dehydrogenase / diacetyl reductase n=1 Tax=Paracoccus halophilus TaxID=376733 RepID=A0A099EXR9_9RHOB|nr:glucose 1-dehydrogenase [Paracoccus halophilus]KGJ03235.1 short-chain dehydrogenase [Paracoccus halophilus]SFA52774.1 meso-butanediol dehydrogenase / (S,S)-butanediol dehydrogenase / diacetyl reductase [Paracoccus halophilus]